jgi:hypothetical protein
MLSSTLIGVIIPAVFRQIQRVMGSAYFNFRANSFQAGIAITTKVKATGEVQMSDPKLNPPPPPPPPSDDPGTNVRTVRRETR